MTSNKVNTTIRRELNAALVSGIVSVLERNKGQWEGTMTELNTAARKVLGRSVPENWPGSPSSLRTNLNRVVRRVREAGVSVKFTRATDRNRTRLVQLRFR